MERRAREAEPRLPVKLTPGVRYHRALCEEHLGQLVEALRDYKAAALQAREENAAMCSGSSTSACSMRARASRTSRLSSSRACPTPWCVWMGSRSARPLRCRRTREPQDRGRGPGRTPSAQTVTLEERASTSLEMKLDPTRPPPAALRRRAAPARPPRAPGRAPRSHDRTVPSWPRQRAWAWWPAASALPHRERRAHRCGPACAQVASLAPDACESQKNEVRAWDWVAVGAWAGAAGAGTIAILSLTRHRDVRSRSGPSACRRASWWWRRASGLEGTF